MSSATIKEELEEIVSKLMEKEGITNYNWKIEGQSEAGDNYMGDIIFFKILNENGKKIHDMVMKTAKRSPKLRKSLPLEQVYSRELYMYSRVFPELQKFLSETKANFELDFIPKIHWTNFDQNRETLVFDNLKQHGYKLRDRKIPWNLEHSLFTMIHYAKFHAISLAFKDQRPELFEELTKNMSDMVNEFMKIINPEQFYSKPMQKIMKLFKSIGRDDLIAKYDGFIEKTVPVLNGEIDNNDKIVISHGDCWNNNFMFKYKDKNETAPWKICFLDFQLASLGSPIIDLSYNIYTTCDKSCLQHLDIILETYYSTLSETVKSLGSNPEILFSREKFQNHWRKYSRFGVLFSCIVIKALLTDPEDAPDLAKRAEEGSSFGESFDFDLKDEGEYNRRVLDVFTFYGDMFL